MRVTETMLHDRTITALQANQVAQQKAFEQVSTSKRINRPSDDPADARSAVKVRDYLAELQQYLRNIDQAKTQVSAMDTAIGSASDLMQRANELAIQGANGTLGADDRAAISQEVDQLIEAMANDASAKVGDQYVFSGFKMDKAPYEVVSPGTVGTYQGDHGVIAARVGSNATIQTNLPGDHVFQTALDALRQLQTDLKSGAAVAQSTIGQIGDGLQPLSTARASIGARANRLDEVATSQTAVVTSSQDLLSQLEDVDMAKAITDLTQRQTTYQASLGVAAKVLQTSLIDYLK